MTIILDGKGWSLNAIMGSGIWTDFATFQMEELRDQLLDASVNASSPTRREKYAKWAEQIQEAIK